MTLSNKATTIVNQMNQIMDEYAKLRKQLSECFEEELGAEFSLCHGTSDFMLQLYHDKSLSTPGDAYEALKAIVDDHTMILTHMDRDSAHYNFRIDDRLYCIVLDREDGEEW